MKNFFRFSTVVLLFVMTMVNCEKIAAQATACPSVNAGPDVTICGGCATLNGVVQGTVATTAYTVGAIPYNPFPYNVGSPVLIGVDDMFSDTVVLPFCFEFFGVTYTRCVIGSNGIINFDPVANANNYNTWPIAAPVPDPTVPDLLNSIMSPWHDIDPSVGGQIYFQLIGQAPCRQLVVSWDQVPMFSCNNLIDAQQIVLYETTNVIDVFIQNKPICSTWNTGAAIEAIQDPTGTTAYVVPGRNYPTQWTASNDGYRFTPAGAPQYTFNWLQNNVSISTKPVFTVCPTVTTTYVAQVVNQTCNGPLTVSDTIVVTVGNGNLTLAASSTPTTCTGATGTATCNPTGTGPFAYSWSPGGQTTQTATGLAAGTYIVYVTDANGCQASMTVTVTASNNTITLASSSVPTNCTANNGTATVNPSGGQAPYTYSWTPTNQTNSTATGLSAGSYTVIVTDANGCTATLTVVVTQNNNSLTLTLSNPPAICNGQSATVTTTVTGGTGPYTYSWVPGNMTGTSITVTPTTNTSYNCYVTDVNGCTVLQTVNVNVDPAITAVLNGSNTICAGQSTALSIAAGGGTPSYTYSWAPSGGTGSIATVSPTTTTTYTVYVTDAIGCTAVSNGITITVSPVVQAGFTDNPVTTTPNNPVVFTDVSQISSGNITCWSWDFGDGGTSVLQNPTHIFTDPGTYYVCLYVCGVSCPDTICNIYVVEPTEVVVPNIITPNGDGKNDSLIFTNLQFYPNSELKVFDRWGVVVYESSNYKNDWQGGRSVDGTYYFVLNIPGIADGKARKGYFEILRHK